MLYEISNVNKHRHGGSFHRQGGCNLKYL